MRQSKLIIFILIFLILVLVPAFSVNDYLETELDDRLKKKREDVRHLFSDISTVNLLNGLYLTEQQMTDILQLARKAQQVKQEFIEKKGAAYIGILEDAERAYRDLFAEIIKGEPARQSSSIEREALRMENQLKEMTDKFMRKMTAELSVLDQEMSDILTSEQQQVIEEFKPCLIPPKDLKNPIRAGQASSNNRAVNMLRRLRKIPSYTWNNRKYQIVSRHVERFSTHRSVMTEEEKANELQRLLTLIEKIRAMTDTDFELEKEKLAEEFRPVNRVHELREELEERVPYLRRPKVSKSAKFLLNERIIPILEKKISR